MGNNQKATTRKQWLEMIDRIARSFEPYGVLITVIALIAALASLRVEINLRDRTLVAMEEEKILRESTLVALKQERELREATLIALLVERVEASRDRKSTNVGHLPILERAARSGVDLKFFDMSDLELTSNGRGIALSGTNLSRVIFRNTVLKDAVFVGTTLIGTNFKGADLRGAVFSVANLDSANLRNANVAGTDFYIVKNLTQQQLDAACIYEGDDPPKRLPTDSSTGKQLVWAGRGC